MSETEQTHVIDRREAIKRVTVLLGSVALIGGSALLEALDRAQKAYGVTHRDDTPPAPPHYFRQIKELALLGYFTSEIGCTQAMRYRETPGRFDPCVPYTPGETAWAGHA